MKQSFMTFACPDYTFDQALALAVKHGYDGIEFRCDSDHRHGVMVEATPKQRAEYRRKLADQGLEAPCLATSLEFINDEAIRQAPARIELAHDLGCGALRVFCGGLPKGLGIENAIPILAHNLRAVAEQAFYGGVRLWLETHDSVSLGANAGRAVRLVDHPAVAINWDTMHPYRLGESLEATWQAIGPLVQHTHFHDAIAAPDQVVITPFGKGGLPMQRMYDLLRLNGYQGYFSGEWFENQMGADVDASLVAFKSGLRKLEEGWQASGKL